jgi:hypothetical protein
LDEEHHKKVFAKYHTAIDAKAVDLDYGTQAGVIRAITEEDPAVTYIGHNGEEVSAEDASKDYGVVAKVALTISKRQAAILNSEIGTHIGRKL